ncbi:M20/M25/M40 family metallo-hydrolase [Flavobacterium sp. JAS]|uniref:M20/M25/M40 family metallo-hydrolase n=1 Tax=Flavobacterium sp. JAS TaxID=2897329 RepID=UPI001E2DCF8E|nr:M20/M25/M40 family metallo-hydrolase [Flavobacterium sp. JAS]MCD0469244.1 M20/M25/M40 family metallo-hydrolase [Flavobacterium sp. JAS]
MKKTILLTVLALNGLTSFAQSNDEKNIKLFYKKALTEAKCYTWLEYLSNDIGSRLSGSASAEEAVQYTKRQLETLGLDKVYLQDVMVPHWVRGEKETAYILDNKTKTVVPICALGASVATPKTGITAEVIEVQSIKELKELGDKVKGKIVFYNRPMDPENVPTFISYSEAGDQRRSGAQEAAKLGAVGTIVRSLSLRLDDFPHTGNQSYGDLPKEQYIPAAAISTNGAELLSKLLKNNPALKFYFKQSCQTLPDVLSHNVIGELTGTVTPENVMVVGGHLDSWDLADGSHDDGAGVVQSMEVVRILKNLNYKPKNTIRVVLFMNEENGGKGGAKYEEVSKEKKENHIFALESDSGGFTPRGFSLEADDANLKKIQGYKDFFEPYLINSFIKGHAGSDIEHLTSKTIVKAGLMPDSQRYFDYHHAANDKFDAINKRELELGAATMTSLIYLVDQNGIVLPTATN